MKQLVKRYAPKPLLNLAVRVYTRVNAIRSFKYDKRRFYNNYSKEKFLLNNRDQLDARLTFHAHALEKGLSHKEIRLGFGKSALSKLAKVMEAYTELNYSKTSDAYLNALSVLREYIKLHKAKDYDITFLKDIFPEDLLQEAAETASKLGGVVQINLDSKKDNRDKNFKDLFINRWSIREYSDKLVDTTLVDEAIEISLKTPSVCNRQSARVLTITDKSLIRTTLKLQGGFTGYDLPPALIVVTSDISASVGAHERNQPYIDGGLFSMSLLLSLEYVGLAACPLNAMLTIASERKIRQTLNIPEAESLIMFMSIGHFTEINPAPKSFRYTKEQISRNVG